MRPSSEATRRRAVALTAVLLVALVVRVLALVLLGDAARPHGDEGYYVYAARSLVDGAGYPGSVRPPGWPAFMAAVMLVFGKGLTAVRVAQIGVSLVMIALVFDLVVRRFGTAAALVSALLCALHPELVHYTHFLWAETLATTLLVAILWTLDRFDGDRRARWLVGAGVLLGAAVLTREMLLYFAPVVLVWLWWREGFRIGPTVHGAALVVVPLLLVVLPWTARNYALHGSFVLVSTTRWLPIAQGNLLPAHGSNLQLGWSHEFAQRYRQMPDELEREAYAREVALQAIRAEQPTWILRKIQRNWYLLFEPRTQLARFAGRRWFGAAAQPLVVQLVPIEAWTYVLLSSLGIVALWLVPGGPTKLLVVGAIVMHLGIYTVANANHRFRLPLQPLLMLYAGPLVVGWRAALARSRARWIGALVSLAIFVTIVAVHVHRSGGMGMVPRLAKQLVDD